MDIGFRVIPSRLSGILLFGRDPSPRWYTRASLMCMHSVCYLKCKCHWYLRVLCLIRLNQLHQVGNQSLHPIKFAVVYNVDASTTECRLLSLLTLFGQSRKWHDDFFFFLFSRWLLVSPLGWSWWLPSPRLDYFQQFRKVKDESNPHHGKHLFAFKYLKWEKR